MITSRIERALGYVSVFARYWADEWLEIQAGIARNASQITPARIVSGPAMLAGIEDLISKTAERSNVLGGLA